MLRPQVRLFFEQFRQEALTPEVAERMVIRLMNMDDEDRTQILIYMICLSFYGQDKRKCFMDKILGLETKSVIG